MGAASPSPREALMDINTVLLSALVTMIGWMGRRMLLKLDTVVAHLHRLNTRTGKLESRMDVQESR